MIKNYIRIISLIIFVIIYILLVYFLDSVNSVNKNAPVAVNGEINLTEWDFQSDGIVALNGEWEYYNHQLIAPDDFKQQPPLTPTHLLHVPGTWGGIDFFNDVDRKGYGTYRLLINISDYNRVLAIKVSSIRFAHNLYINGVLLGHSGVPSEEEAAFVPGNTPYQLFFTPDNDQIELIIQVSNYHFPTGGIINSIVFGSAEQIAERENFRSGVDMGLILLLTFIGLYCFITFSVSRQNKSYLYIGLYMITLALNSALYHGKIVQRILPHAPFELIYELQDIVQFVGGIAIFYFISSFQVKLLDRKWMHILFMPIYIYLAMVLTFPYYVHIQYKYYVIVYLVFIPAFMLVKLIIHFKNVYHEPNNSKMNKIELLIVILATTVLVGYVSTSLMYGENLLASDILNKLFTICFTLLMLIVMTLRYARIQQQSKALTEQLMLSNQLKDEFLLNTSHELKTPLHGIQNMVSYLLSGQQKTVEDERQQLWLIRDTTMKLSLLVNDLIDVSLLKHGKLNINSNVVDLKVAVDIVLDLLEFERVNKNISMLNNVPAHTFVEADEMRLRQVLYNLVHNSIKYTKEGVIIIHAKANSGTVSIWVKDTGIGIAPEKCHTIFQNFEQVHDKTDNDGGMGVGLYISQKLVQLMEGVLEVEWTELGKGTHMHIQLPKALNYEGELPIQANFESRPSNENNASSLDYMNGHKHTILIVDDEVSNIYSILPLLKQASYNVLTAFSAKEALKKMENNVKVDLIILDMMMPEISGLNLCRNLREKYSILDLPIIFTTVKDSPSDITLAFRAGANDYVTKPFAGETLIARIHTLIAMKTSIQNAIDNELAFHHAQIKPHFLYNALSSVISFCYIDGEKAAYLLTMLSKYLRYILDVDRTVLSVPLSKELELIEAYIEIEKARFGDHLKFTFDIDKALYPAQIPFLSIQPFVENAIRHGIFNNIEQGHVQLKVSKVANMISIVIEDNGKGIEPALLAKLQMGQAEGDSIAITNIYKRIAMTPKASIIMESKLNYGTTVTLLIPFE